MHKNAVRTRLKNYIFEHFTDFYLARNSIFTLEIKRTDRCCSQTESVTAQICSGRNRTEPNHTYALAAADRRGGRRVARRHGDN